MPQSTTAKWPLQRDALSFYGDPYSKGFESANIVNVQCPWMLKGSKHSIVRIHKKCSASLARVLSNVWDAAGKSQPHIEELHYDIYDGSYVLRAMRGGHALSMHSFGCAMDWDAKDNQQHSTHHIFNHQSLLVVKFIEEGWIWGGDWSLNSIDAMHFQAARVHN